MKGLKEGVPLPDTWGRGLSGALGRGRALLKGGGGMRSGWQGSGRSGRSKSGGYIGCKEFGQWHCLRAWSPQDCPHFQIPAASSRLKPLSVGKLAERLTELRKVPR